jgi:hypothetical protein
MHCTTLCTGQQPTPETTVMFIDDAQLDLRMDHVNSADAFPQTAPVRPEYSKQTACDYTYFNEQCPSHLQQAAVDPLAYCAQLETGKENHYGDHYDHQRYTLVALATGSFGCLGRAQVRHINALATEYVARRGFRVDGELPADAVARYRSSALAMIRGRLSIALHTAVSAKVEKYLAIAKSAGGQDGLALDLEQQAMPVDGLWDL